MKRIQLFEFEDYNWFPKLFRTSMTNLIMVLHKMLGTSSVVSNLILQIKKRHDFSKIIDLGSGSGGAMLEVVKQVNSTLKNPIHLMLTDLHPNSRLVNHINENLSNHTTYKSESVDATQLNDLPQGLKTMMNSFHHMPPKVAKKILKSAQDHRQPLLIYEIGENFVPTILWWVLLPLSLAILFIMALFMTPFAKHITWKQLLFTYIIPIIPLCYAWDGQASTMRTYTFDDVELMLNDFKNDNYSWEIGKAKKANGKALGYYILGLPKFS